MSVHDGDKDDRISLHLSGPHARVFRITSKGDIVISDLRYLNGSSAHLVVVAEDSGVPPRRASVPVVVRYPPNFSLKDFFLIQNGRVEGEGEPAQSFSHN